jgi:mannonate dehydratase
MYTDQWLRFLRQMGVTYIDASPSTGLGIEDDGRWHADKLARFREHVESFGLVLSAIHLPLSSGGVANQPWPDIVLAGPDRDRQIDLVCQSIEAAAKAGIGTLLYNLALVHVLRTPWRTPGRGGATYSHFDWEVSKKDPLLPFAPVSEEEEWERIKYFVDRVIPVAEAVQVRMGCHQHDPGIPPGERYGGVPRVLGTIEGVKRFVELRDSPYHGLNFCQGTISEMCSSPEEVYDAIRYFGSRKRIFFVHFRNIRGTPTKFDEVYPDEGQIDFCKAIRIYKEVGYDGLLVPDHVPEAPDDPGGFRAHAFSLGYIKALIAMVESEA